MKLSRFSYLLVLGLIITVAAGSGCRKRPGYVTNLPGAHTQNPSDQGLASALGTNQDESIKSLNESGAPQPDADRYKGWNEDAATLKAQTVYFDFDSSVVKASEKGKVSAVADYLKGNSQAALRVEGNCDERGTEEYNRSLGERRALAVREELIRLGIDPIKVVTVSYGEDRPVAQGHDESAYKQNRRDDFIVLTPPAK